MNNETKPRSDSWTEVEEEVLAKIVMRYIREGRTLSEAFDQASYRIERTSPACQFRWHTYVKNKPGVIERYNRAKSIARENKKQNSRVTPGFASEYEEAFRRPIIDSLPDETVEAIKEPVVDERYLVPKEEPRATEHDIDAEIGKNPIYRSVLDVMLRAQRKQVAYGLDKYVESLNVNSWSTLETIDHIISETVDQLHYLSMLKMKILEELQNLQ